MRGSGLGDDHARSEAFTPVWCGELDLTAPRLPERLTSVDGRPFSRARLLIRAGGTSLGFVEIETPDGITNVDQVVGTAQRRFADQAAHALADTGWTVAEGPLVTIVLCTRDRAQSVRRTLKSLGALQYTKLEIIVVDNAPSDELTHDIVRAFMRAESRLRYVREPHRGLSYARNRGLAAATGELIAFTDDDVEVDPLWIHGLMRGFQRGEDVACVTGLVASASLAHPAEQYFDRRVSWSSSCEPRIFTRDRGPLDSPLHPYTAGVFGTGANFAAVVSVLRSIGGFDQCLGAGSPTRGGEDLDMFVRLITGGHALSYEPSALVWHEHRVDDASLRNQMYAYGLGLTAYLTKYLLAPRSRTLLARRVLSGLWYALGLVRRSRRAGAAASVHSGVGGMEILGMIAGPSAYLRARRTQKREHLTAVAP